MDYSAALRETIQNALNPANGAPAPILGSSAGPELQKFYDINFQLPLSSGATKALSSQTDAEVANQKAAQEAKVQELQDKLGGKNYRQEKKADGGYAFFDNQGNEISAYEYAAKTGSNPASLLKDSENPIDISYLHDYNNLQDFMDAVLNNDTEAKNAFYKKQPALRSMSPQDVLKRFKQAYPTVYGGGGFSGPGSAGQRSGTTYIPNLNSLLNNAGLSGAVGG